MSVDDYRGLYTTHFEGIPDESLVCAVLTNQGEEPVSWVRLKLLTRSEFEDTSARLRSFWTYRGHIAPGASVAVALENPPVGARVLLSVQRAGLGTPPRGRSVHATGECSEAALLALVRERHAARASAGADVAVRVLPVPPRP